MHVRLSHVHVFFERVNSDFHRLRTPAAIKDRGRSPLPNRFVLAGSQELSLRFDVVLQLYHEESLKRF